LPSLYHGKEERIRILEQDLQRMHEAKDEEFKERLSGLKKQLEKAARSKESSLRSLQT
jgi:hypothetical protein